jgi:hypothetical protein
MQASAAATREDRLLRPMKLERRSHVAAGVPRARYDVPAADQRCADLSQRRSTDCFLLHVERGRDLLVDSFLQGCVLAGVRTNSMRARRQQQAERGAGYAQIFDAIILAHTHHRRG